MPTVQLCDDKKSEQIHNKIIMSICIINHYCNYCCMYFDEIPYAPTRIHFSCPHMDVFTFHSFYEWCCDLVLLEDCIMLVPAKRVRFEYQTKRIIIIKAASKEVVERKKNKLPDWESNPGLPRLQFMVDKRKS